MSAESGEPQADDPGQLDLFPEKTPDEETMRKMRKIAGSSNEMPFEADLKAPKLGRLLSHGEKLEDVLRAGTHRIREETSKKRRGKIGRSEGLQHLWQNSTFRWPWHEKI